MNEYRIKVSVRNNLLLCAIADAGYTSVSDFARSAGLPYGSVQNIVGLREAPINNRGEFTHVAKQLMEVLGACPHDLWTDKQLSMAIARNTLYFSCAETMMEEFLTRNGEAMLLPDPAADLEKQDLERVVHGVLEAMKPKERAVLTNRFMQEKTLEEIGESFGVTGERIREIEQKALRRLRHPSWAAPLRKALPDVI